MVFGYLHAAGLGIVQLPVSSSANTGSMLSSADERKLLFALLRPAARLAERRGTALKGLTELAELSYFQQLRRNGLKMREVSERLGVGMSKVGLLSRELKEHFQRPEREHGLGREVLSLLWSMPLTFGRIVQAVPNASSKDIRATLDQLEEEGRVRRIEGRTERFALAQKRHRLDVVPWMARIDGLNTLMDHVFGAVTARFLDRDDDAFVRNVVFRARPADIARLRQAYEDVLFPLICELDEAVDGDDEAVELALSLLWSTQSRGGQR